MHSRFTYILYFDLAEIACIHISMYVQCKDLLREKFTIHCELSDKNEMKDRRVVSPVCRTLRRYRRPSLKPCRNPLPSELCALS